MFEKSCEIAITRPQIMPATRKVTAARKLNTDAFIASPARQCWSHVHSGECYVENGEGGDSSPGVLSPRSVFSTSVSSISVFNFFFCFFFFFASFLAFLITFFAGFLASLAIASIPPWCSANDFNLPA